MKKLKLDKEETELLDSFESGEFLSVSTGTKVLERYRTIAKDTLKKDKRVNIRMTERDLKRFKIKALEEGIPYQTLISSILHKYIGRSFD
jgi:predicted DNA binding CopG/RHH family protein